MPERFTSLKISNAAGVPGVVTLNQKSALAMKERGGFDPDSDSPVTFLSLVER
jgi:hypothetical protein